MIEWLKKFIKDNGMSPDESAGVSDLLPVIEDAGYIRMTEPEAGDDGGIERLK